MPTMPNEDSRPFDIAIVGETNLDLILYGLPETMPVEHELLGSSFELTLGGSSSILAHNLAVLGSRVAFVTLVGDDEMGQIALDRLRCSGLHLLQIPHKKSLGTGVTVLLPHGNRRHILTSPGAISGITVDDLDVGYLSSARHFHLSSFFLQTGLQKDLPELFKKLKAAGLTISLDTNDDPSGRWNGVLDQLLDSIDLLLPNEEELKQIAQKDTLEDALDALAERIPLIVVKCGSRGAVVQQGRNRTRIAPLQVDPVDTIGAGDSFNAGFLHSYLRDGDPHLAAAMANVTGALSTLRPGGTEAFRNVQLRTTFLADHSPLRL
jgi:sugar/nucleoside kinase (ribokinase family)